MLKVTTNNNLFLTGLVSKEPRYTSTHIVVLKSTNYTKLSNGPNIKSQRYASSPYRYVQNVISKMNVPKR